MVPLSEQDPRLWDRRRIDEANALLARATELGPPTARLLQAKLQRAWCARGSFAKSPQAYETVLALDPPPAEERWIRHKPTLLKNEA